MNTKPTKIHLHKESKILELVVDNANYKLSAEFLRVHSRSAEVTGHGPGQEVLVDGKINVGIERLEAVGNYGLKIIFDDKHDSGIYSWSYLVELCHNEPSLWESYLEKLKQEGKSRDPHTSVVQFSP